MEDGVLSGFLLFPDPGMGGICLSFDFNAFTMILLFQQQMMFFFT